jgi:PAS domain-containing protein
VGKSAAILFESPLNKDVSDLVGGELRSRQRFRSDILLRTATGGLVWLDMNIKTILDRTGVARRYVGIGNDITERKRVEESLKRSEARAQLLREVAASANSAVTVWAAFQTALEGLGRHMGWPLGHAYVLDESGTRLVDGGQWHVREPERFRDFIEATRRIVFTTGVGLPGHVMEEGRAIWIEDLHSDPRFVRTPEAQLSGVKSGFAFPIREHDRVAAVLEFFTTEEVPPNGGLIELSEQVSVPLGIVIERKHTEEELVKLSRAVENSPASVVITNRNGDIEYVNSKFARLTGYSREEVLVIMK